MSNWAKVTAPNFVKKRGTDEDRKKLPGDDYRNKPRKKRKK